MINGLCFSHVYHGTNDLGARTIKTYGNVADVSCTFIFLCITRVPYIKVGNVVGTKSKLFGSTLQLNAVQDASTPPCIAKAGIYDIK